MKPIHFHNKFLITYNIIWFSGGSLVKFLATGLPKISTDWSKWELFFCDERYVPTNNPDSTFGAYKEHLVSNVPLNESQFIRINSELPLSECAADYQNKILQKFKSDIPSFDLLLLGMGPDGHTCSLFPSHPLLEESKLLIAPISDSPKPPPERVTMTFSLVNNSKCCIFAMTGSGKADMLKVGINVHPNESFY